MQTTTTQPRVRAHPDDIAPKLLIRLTLALIIFVLALVTVAKLSGRPLEAVRAQKPLVHEIEVTVISDRQGSGTLTDQKGQVIATFDSQNNGFLSSIERVLHRERLKSGAIQGTPILLQLREADQITVTDPQSGWWIDLASFGSSNVSGIAKLLAQP